MYSNHLGKRTGKGDIRRVGNQLLTDLFTRLCPFFLIPRINTPMPKYYAPMAFS